jgi:mRNA-degrading endonuclease RelE of RelBE toxin-antitoxin system
MFQLSFTARAEDDLSRLNRPMAQRVLKKMRWLADSFNTITPERLAGPWRDVFKLRVGDYRVLYTCNRKKQEIIIHFIRHRREVYKMK